MTGLQTDPQPSLPVFPGRRACVIGAGLGGLALAVRLQAAGIETVLVEAGGRPGGHARGEDRDGFVFDSGPGALADPAALGELWALGGEELADHVDLLAVQPLRRFSWPDGTTFDLAADEAA
ncbi:MAG: NAD(P)-binding protein, partial [Novosphingobium sp.]|nr:NAD(P)-binding protein [Novosphingobium sp.]